MKKRKHSVGYFSSYDRGLDVLLSIWPYIVERVPDVTLDVYYGFNTFDKFHSKNPERMKWKWGLIRKFNQFGVVDHGRVSHEELAKAMQEIQVWAYPTSFPEISCLTAMKAQAAGMVCVTSGYAALQETVKIEEEEVVNIHDKPEKLEKFAQRVIDALLNPPSDEELKAIKKQVMAEYSWKNVARQWDEVLGEKVTTEQRKVRPS